MTRRPFILTLSLAGAALGVSLLAGNARSQNAMTSIAVTSPEFANGGAIPSKYTCDGAGKSPPLEWSGVPGGTKSLALVVDDPDAPRGTYVHWLAFDIPPATMILAEGASVPSGAREGKNGKGGTGWTPPCPPSGVHHYRFKVYALADTMKLDKPSADDLTRAMKGKVLGQGELTGTYARVGK
jgi:Raf kinase inhibitor-like YbhB/YbcL family protein